ncbi:MAG TPA: ATP-grasp domain-containing protein [Polyangiaceae bacterium]|nr:ATP-grasp domain-containing protein [Polyangiaceae bacterium]
MTLVLFPSAPMNLREIDEDFEVERQAAKKAGLATALIDHTRLVMGEPLAALAGVGDYQGEVIYRGWMLTPSQYETLYTTLAGRGIHLLNDPAAYRTCHYLPDSYGYIAEHTARSVWTPLSGEPNFEALANLLASFGSKPLIVKDYVKSQKHYWDEACFISQADDRVSVERVVRRFLELQADDLNEGLVFREFLPLKRIGTHPQSGMPLSAEFRIFWLDAEPLLSHRYWAELGPFDSPLPIEDLRAIAEQIPSRFFSMDVAFLESGEITIVELGDGQVAGLPSPNLAPEFFRRIAHRVVDAQAH